MHSHYTYPLLFAISLAARVSSASFSLKETHVGRDFFDKWKFETFDDPTHGRTNYVDKETAVNSNLSFATDHKFFMQPDSTKHVRPSSRGRDSVRIISQASYADSVVILDLQHMPFGCATWPAFWSLSAKGPWPHGGEIDIIEGVHNQKNNLASLHTTAHCTMPQHRAETGEVTSTNCDVGSNGNEGCGTSFRKSASYGRDFNFYGGGYYALARTKEDGIRVWFWSRHELFIPLDVKGHLKTVNPALWGTPETYFPTDNCNHLDHFDAHRLVFDLTFCGDWAGSVWSSTGCGPGSCSNYVDNNPHAFEDAYWEINSLKIFTPSGW